MRWTHKMINKWKIVISIAMVSKSDTLIWVCSPSSRPFSRREEDSCIDSNVRCVGAHPAAWMTQTSTSAFTVQQCMNKGNERKGRTEISFFPASPYLFPAAFLSSLFSFFSSLWSSPSKPAWSVIVRCEIPSRPLRISGHKRILV